MRLASAEVIPLRYGSYGPALDLHLDELRRQVVRKARGESDEGGLEADFTAVLAALEAFGAAGRALDAALAELVERADGEAAASVNAALIQIEKAFLSEDGLPGRPWFKNLVWAPGLTTGYAAWPFPELAEAVENDDSELFAHGAERLTGVLAEATLRLEAATALAGGS